jgi:hypothetical protein
LKADVSALNRRLAQSESSARIWKTAAVSLGLAFAVVELGRVIVR